LSKLLDNLNEQQANIIREKDGKILVLAGAGTGKCVTGDTYIYTDKGIVKIKDIPTLYKVEKDMCQAGVLSYSLNGFKLKNKTSHWYKLEKSQTIELKTKSGYEIKGTPEHPILTVNKDGRLKFKKLSEINRDDIVVISKNNNIWGDYDIDPNVAYLMGLLVGDRCLSSENGTIGFSRNDEEISNVYKEILKANFGMDNVKTRRKKGTNSVTHSFTNTKIKKELEGMGLKMTTAHFKEVPWSVMQSPRNSAISFLQGLFDTEASVNKTTMEYTTASKNLAKQVQIILLNLGIRTSLSNKTASNYPENNYYRIHITGSSLRTFSEEVGFKYSLHKKKRLEEAINRQENSNVDLVYNQEENLNYILNEYYRKDTRWIGSKQHLETEEKRISLKDYVGGRRNPSANKILEIIEEINPSDEVYAYLKNLAENFFLDKIDYIKEGPEEVVYDFTVPDTHCFVSNGMVSHNTRTLTYKVAYLIEQGLKPYNILAVTFTNKAAKEMKDRIKELVEVTNNRSWWIGTFHSICVRILIRYGSSIGIPNHFTIADEKDQKNLIKQIIKDNTDLSNFEPEEILGFISDAKNNVKYPSDLFEEPDMDHNIVKAYETYQTKLRKMNALDFDDLIIETLRLLRVDEDVRKRYQEQFKYVMVDESQDLNKAQYELAKILSEGYNNLSLIGDQDQGIYSWRGANISIIDNFSKLPGTKIMKLEQNYRCTQTIIDASNAVVSNNQERLDKRLVTDNPRGESITKFTADTQYHEAAFVGSVISYLCHKIEENDYEDFTILYRTNNQSRVIEDELNKRRIPYQIIGGMSFYERAEIKDMLAYLKLIINPYDTLSLQRIINVPKRGVGKKTIEKVIGLIEEKDCNAVEVLSQIEGNIPRVSKKAIEALKELQDDINFFANEMERDDPSQFIKLLAAKIGYLDMLDKSDEKDRVLNIYELAEMALTSKQLNETSLDEFVKNLSLISDQDTVTDDNAVKLMTAHTAKGLEFPIVFIVGLEENIFPHYLSVISNDPNQLEEERRLFYVSMTRAKERLYLTNAETRSFFGKEKKNEPSRFLDEIPNNLIKKL
jgi:DNA helicase-2/ATP-dependent DNA helicase PcrA